MTQEQINAAQLAELVLSMQFVTAPGIAARQLARKVLGIPEGGQHPPFVPITTNGTTRVIPADEPVFLIRGQDIVGAAAVLAWADLAEEAGAALDIVDRARDHARAMDEWPKKKVPDLEKVNHG